MLSATLILLAAQLITAQTYDRLAEKVVPYDQRPFKMDTVATGRGPQYGYNNCSAATTGPESLCQTAFVNSLEDFCVWGLPEPGETVGDSEAEAVAYCTTGAHGTRVIPPGAIYGAQMIQTDKYIQVVGYVDQTKLNIAAGDYGGEMDPIGADGRGNPLGGLMYSTAFSNNNEIQQTRYWTNFMGGDQFCIKVCIPNGPDAARECEHIYDRIGCRYNVYADYAAINGTFEACQGDVGLYAGVYRGENGRLSTYTQPAESLGAISTINYTPSVPPSSSCTSLATQPDAFLIVGRAVSTSAASSASSAASGAASSAGSALPSGSAAAISSRPNNAAAATTAPSSGALPLTIGSLLIASGLALFALIV